MKAGFVVALVLTALGGCLSWYHEQPAAEQPGRVAHTHEASNTLELLPQPLADAKAAERGYQPAGLVPFLARYETGNTAAGQDLQALPVAEHPVDERRLLGLRRQVHARIKLVTERSGSGRNTQPSRGRVQELGALERGQFEEFAWRAQAARTFTLPSIALGSLVGLLFLSLAAIAAGRQIAIRTRAQAQVDRRNADLEQRRAALQSEALERIFAQPSGPSEQMYQLLLDGIQDYAVYLLDLDGYVISWNPGAARILGYLAEEIIGKHFSCFDQESDPSRQSLGQARETGRFEEQGWLVRQDRSRFWANVVTAPLYQEDGTPRGYFEIVRDLTDGKRAETALAESESRLAGIIASAMDSILTLDEQQRIVLFNNAAGTMFRCTEAEAMGQPVTRYIPHRLHSAHGGHIPKFDETGVPTPVMGPKDVLWALRADGQEFQTEASISHAVTGGTKLSTVILRDVTDRVQAAAIQERLAAVVESSADAIISKTLNGTITAWNRGAEKLFGYSAEEAVGQLLLTLLPPDRIHEESDILERIRCGQSVEHFETVRIRKDGTAMYASATISPVKDGSGMIVGASTIARDITERKRVEEALRASERRLRLALDGARLGTWHLNLATDEFEGSPLSLELLGLAANSKFNRSLFLAALHPADRIRVAEAMNQTLAGPSEYDVEYRTIWPDGTQRWIAAKGEVYKNSAGENTHLGGILFDVTERHLAEEALRESEERFHTMLNGIPQLAWMAKADGHIFWYNQRWYEYTGTTPEQMEGWGWQSVHDPERLPEVLARWRASIADGDAFAMEFPLRAADGSFGMFLTRIVPLKDSSGCVLRWFGTNTDISERSRAEERQAELARELSHHAEELARSREALEAQTAMFQLVLESMGEGLIAADLEGHFLIFNRAAHDLMGRGPRDLPTEQWTPHYQVFEADGITPYPPDRLPLVLALHGESVQVELMVRPAETLPVRSLEVIARPLRDARGKLCGGVAVLRDVTERKQSEAELARQDKELRRSRVELETQTLMLQSVLDSMLEGLIAADEQGRFILWNPAAEKIVGLSGSNISPEQWSAHYGIYLPDTDTLFPMEQNSLVRAIRGEASTTEMFIRNPKLDHGVWIESNGSPLKDKNGVLRGGVVAFRDITQKKEDQRVIRKLNEDLEAKIVQRTAQLEAANRELEAFTYSVSHDLRAPLRHIASFSKILSQDFGSSMDPEAQRHLQRIENGARRMALLVDGLLSLARLGQQSLKRSPTDLLAIVHGVILILQPECTGRQVEWRIGPLPTLDCDPILMAQVFQNLLSNALKYSSRKEKAVIEIDTIERAGKPPVLFVRDNGAGFSMQYAEKLFGVFQRLHSDAEFEGTGVGLATVNRIIQRHGGHVWAEAEVDRGATFYFTLGEKEPTETTLELNSSGALEPEHEHRG